jgi:hypothetical protein
MNATKGIPQNFTLNGGGRGPLLTLPEPIPMITYGEDDILPFSMIFLFLVNILDLHTLSVT